MPEDQVMDLTPLVDMFLIIFAVAAVFAIITVIATWRILKKMDKPGVLALIPFVGSYVVFKGCCGASCARKYVFALIVMYICTYMPSILSQQDYFTQTIENEMMITQLLTNEITFAQFVEQMGTVQCVCMLVEFIALVVILVLTIGYSFRLAKAFDHGFFFGLGLLLMPYIFYFVLAFGDSEYDDYYVDD